MKLSSSVDAFNEFSSSLTQHKSEKKLGFVCQRLPLAPAGLHAMNFGRYLLILIVR